MSIKAVGFDFFGTLVDAQADSRSCILSMCNHLQHCGYDVSMDDFLSNYRFVAAEHRKTRYNAFREVDNCVWVADTLNRMGIEVESSNDDVKSAVEKYFDQWNLSLIEGVPQVLERLGRIYKMALVSNFTYSGFIYRILKRFKIFEFFDSIIISDTFGWRKPHSNIFEYFLKSLEVEASEAVFIGDDLEADVKGAKDVGIRAVLFVRQDKKKYSLETSVFPNFIVSSLIEFEELLMSGKI